MTNLSFDYEGSDAIEHLDSVIEDAISKRHKKLSDLMKETRQLSGLKQSELAERLGVTQSWVSKMESGSNHTLDNIVDYFESLGYKVKLTINKSDEVEF